MEEYYLTSYFSEKIKYTKNGVLERNKWNLNLMIKIK